MEAPLLKEYGIAQYYQAIRLFDTAVLIVAAGQAPNLSHGVACGGIDRTIPWY
jgi:hypothetical protein